MSKFFTNTILFSPVRLNIKELHHFLEGKSVLITGASYGIGEALAYLLAAEGIHLILIARTAERLEEIKQEVEKKGARADIVALDLRSEEARRNLIHSLRAYPAGIDVFVNNAGKSIQRSLEESVDRYHDYTRTMAINYFAPVALCLGLFNVLKKKKGHIINISAVNVLLPPAPHWAAYQASKCAFDQWLRAALPELRLHGISTTSVYLPLVKTRMADRSGVYAKVPALTAGYAARIIGKSILTRSSCYKPWWMVLAEPAALVFRPVWNRLAIYLFMKR